MAEHTDELADVLHLQHGEQGDGTDGNGQLGEPSDPNVLAYLSEFPDDTQTGGTSYPPRGQSTYSTLPNISTLNSTLHHGSNTTLSSDRTSANMNSEDKNGEYIFDPQLADLAAIAASNAMENGQNYTMDYSSQYVDYGALGEMGGKRKKLPHERAGWSEMDNPAPKKRGRKKVAQGEDGQSPQPEAEAQDDGTLSRAEQNKRAQQAFRRRREERMKDLENAAAALEPLQRRFMECENKLKDATINFDAARTEVEALRSILGNLVRAHGHSILKPDGSLALDPTQARSGSQTEEELKGAFFHLENQARNHAMLKYEKTAR